MWYRVTDSFHHNGEFEFTTSADGSTFTSLVSRNGATELKKNKYALNYVDVPFEFRLRTMNKTTEKKMKYNFRFYLGFKAGVLVNDHLKISDNISKRKIFDLPNTLPYRYGPTIRVGLNKIVNWDRWMATLSRASLSEHQDLIQNKKYQRNYKVQVRE